MYGRSRAAGIALCMAAIGALAGCASGHPAFHGAHSMAGHAAKPADSGQPAAEVPVLDLSHLSALQDILPALADRRVVYVGETHDRYAHHLTQLEIIKAMHASNPRLAIGMEMFQQPFQGYLNDYIAGVLSESEMLVATEYFRRWRYDYRLYAPILRYARDNGLPVVALNVAGDLVEKVRAQGIDGLDAADRARLPADIERGNAEYEARLRAIYELHPHTEGRGFERFLDGQLVWDEGMAERAARYLEEHPGHAMVVLAGSGHLAYGDGIPRRLERRVPVQGAIVLNGWEGEIAPGVADYLLMPAERTPARRGPHRRAARPGRRRPEGGLLHRGQRLRRGRHRTWRPPAHDRRGAGCGSRRRERRDVGPQAGRDGHAVAAARTLVRPGGGEDGRVEIALSAARLQARDGALRAQGLGSRNSTPIR
ncbi:MAG: ChaN family lipoprotein [Gammaproteobacteria bacterium]|nr:ChaN family lipoprotein [Gammaproteobacteria bacterium]